MLDGYTTTDRYPYAEPVRGIGNYIRNSVKVTVDAYDGTVDLLRGRRRPIRSSAPTPRRFPGLLKPLARDAEGPAGATSAIPRISSRSRRSMYATYHMEDPQVFYNKEDLWAVPRRTVRRDATREMEPYFTIMRLPGESQGGVRPAHALQPEPPRQHDRPGWPRAPIRPTTAASSSTTSPSRSWCTGRARSTRGSTRTRVISQQLSLWNQQGSTVHPRLAPGHPASSSR